MVRGSYVVGFSSRVCVSRAGVGFCVVILRYFEIRYIRTGLSFC